MENFRKISTDSLPGEEWKPVKDYEDCYMISNFGRCKGLCRVTQFGERTKVYPERILTPKTRKKLYSSYIFSKENVQTTMQIHRLVAIHFIANPENKRTVNHKDGNKQNNHVDNLEWHTYSENLLHALDTGLNKNRKLTKEQVLEIRLSKLTDIELGKKYNVRQGNIWNIRNNKSWQHVQ